MLQPSQTDPVSLCFAREGDACVATVTDGDAPALSLRLSAELVDPVVLDGVWLELRPIGAIAVVASRAMGEIC